MPRLRDAAKWNGLSSNYRTRLERNGITKDRWIAGDSLKAARGHKPGGAPEHPSDAEKAKNREKYRDYIERRKRLIDRVIEKKRAEYGDYWKYDPEAAKKAAHTNPLTKKPPKMNYMKQFLSDDFDMDQVDFEDEEWAFIFYHSFAG